MEYKRRKKRESAYPCGSCGAETFALAFYRSVQEWRLYQVSTRITVAHQARWWTAFTLVWNVGQHQLRIDHLPAAKDVRGHLRPWSTSVAAGTRRQADNCLRQRCSDAVSASQISRLMGTLCDGAEIIYTDAAVAPTSSQVWYDDDRWSASTARQSDGRLVNRYGTVGTSGRRPYRGQHYRK